MRSHKLLRRAAALALALAITLPAGAAGAAQARAPSLCPSAPFAPRFALTRPAKPVIIQNGSFVSGRIWSSTQVVEEA